MTDIATKQPHAERDSDEKIPRISNLQSAPITAVMLTIEAVLIILATSISLLSQCTRDYKATSPYLSLTMFFRMLFPFASVTITVLSSSVIHDGVFFCTVPRWRSSLGLHLIFAPLIVRMLRVYHVFTYFGKLGKRV